MMPVVIEEHLSKYAERRHRWMSVPLLLPISFRSAASPKTDHHEIFIAGAVRQYELCGNIRRDYVPAKNLGIVPNQQGCRRLPFDFSARKSAVEGKCG